MRVMATAFLSGLSAPQVEGIPGICTLLRNSGGVGGQRVARQLAFMDGYEVAASNGQQPPQTMGDFKNLVRMCLSLIAYCNSEWHVCARTVLGRVLP